MCIFFVYELMKMVGGCYVGFFYFCFVFFYVMKIMVYSLGVLFMMLVCE